MIYCTSLLGLREPGVGHHPHPQSIRVDTLSIKCFMYLRGKLVTSRPILTSTVDFRFNVYRTRQKQFQKCSVLLHCDHSHHTDFYSPPFLHLLLCKYLDVIV